MKRVCLISTVNHNVGDDFVRAGIVWLLNRVLGEVDGRVIHKHFPVSARGGLWSRLDHGTRIRGFRNPWRAGLSKLCDALPLHPSSDLLLSSDIVVQCGAPVYWKNAFSKCSQTEWFAPLIERRWRRVHERVPLLNLGAGSCQPWGSDGTEISGDPDCRAFIGQFSSWAAVTTVRDALAQQILRQCGHQAPLLPCPSVFAPQAVGVQAQQPEFAALNYMPAGGHYHLAGDGAALRRQWENGFCTAAAQLARQGPCLLICHNRAEEKEAARILPELPRFYSPHWQDYLGVYARCRFAFVNRVHGAVVAAAMGKPVVLIGNDTRILTAAEVPGIKVLPVTADPAAIANEVSALAAFSSAPDSMTPFLRQTERAYLDLLQPVLLR